ARAAARRGARSPRRGAARRAPVHARRGTADGRPPPAGHLLHAAARRARLLGPVPRRGKRGARVRARGRSAVPRRLDEVAAGRDRKAEPARRHAWARDDRRAAADRRARARVGSHGSGGRGARRHVRLCRAVDRHLPAARAGTARASACTRRERRRARGGGGGARAVKVLVVSGIWPPDVGGPAAHAPEVADFLHERGHDVDVVTTAWAPPAQRAYRVSAVTRTIPVGLRHYRGAALVRRRARDADVVYTTGMFGRSALGSHVARTPYVVKLTGDPAFERARCGGL